jgi:hypothetical protein
VDETPAAADDAAPATADAARRRRFVDTLPGDTPALVASPPPADPDPSERTLREESEEFESGEPRKRHVSTIVGHPATAPQPPSGAPVLSPPKWRGAQAYLEGAEPQPRISSIPTPPLVGTTWSNPPSKVTTKIGPPPPPNALEPPAPAAAAADAISDKIQEMLDGQTSVAMQVEEPAGSDKQSAKREQLAIEQLEPDEPPIDEAEPEDLAVDELPIDEELDAIVEAEPLPAVAAGEQPAPPARPAPAPRPLARIALRADPNRNGESQVSRLPAVVEVAAAPAERTSPAPQSPATSNAKATSPEPAASAGNAMAAQQAKRGDAAASARPQRAAPAATASTADERKRPAAVPQHSGVSSTLAPAETMRVDDSRASAGVLLVAAMVLIGVGGWFGTRGGYPGPAHLATRPPDPAAAQAPVPPPPPAQPSTVPPGVRPPETARAPGSAQAAVDARAAKSPTSTSTNAAKHVRNGVKSQGASDSKANDEEPAARTDSSDQPVLRVVPHEASKEAPDIPTRENVLAALAPIRPAVAECARGQHGTAQLDITVASTGFVTQAIVGGDFSGTPAGSCIARVARTAQFVPFKKPRFRVIYPFSL